MPRTTKRFLCAVALAAVATFGGTACGVLGGGDTKEACDKIQQEIRSISSAGMKQVSDPNGLAKTYADGAEKIRGYGKEAGGDVEGAANDVATALDGLGKQVAARSAQIPDQQPLVDAGVKLKNSCE